MNKAQEAGRQKPHHKVHLVASSSAEEDQLIYSTEAIKWCEGIVVSARLEMFSMEEPALTSLNLLQM